MLIKSLSGLPLFESNDHSLRSCLERAVANQIDMRGANLRGGNLRYAKLDEGRFDGASFWGADLSNADMAAGSFKRGDFRASRLFKSCLAESNFAQSDFRGAYFEDTIFRETDFTKAQFSCPSIFTCPIEDAKSFDRALFWHLGEVACEIYHREKPCYVTKDIVNLYNHRYII